MKKIMIFYVSIAVTLLLGTVSILYMNHINSVPDLEQATTADSIISIIDDQKVEADTPAQDNIAVDLELTSNTGSQSGIFEMTDTHGWYHIKLNNSSHTKYKILLKDGHGKIQGEFEIEAGSNKVVKNTVQASGSRSISITSTDGSKLTGHMQVLISHHTNTPTAAVMLEHDSRLFQAVENYF